MVFTHKAKHYWWEQRCWMQPGRT